MCRPSLLRQRFAVAAARLSELGQAVCSETAPQAALASCRGILNSLEEHLAALEHIQTTPNYPVIQIPLTKQEAACYILISQVALFSARPTGRKLEEYISNTKKVQGAIAPADPTLMKLTTGNSGSNNIVTTAKRPNKQNTARPEGKKKCRASWNC